MPSAKKSTGKSAPPDLPEDLSHKEYKDELYRLQVELVKLRNVVRLLRQFGLEPYDIANAKTHIDAIIDQVTERCNPFQLVFGKAGDLHVAYVDHPDRPAEIQAIPPGLHILPNGRRARGARVVRPPAPPPTSRAGDIPQK